MVGTTERFDEWQRATCTALGPLAKPTCRHYQEPPHRVDEGRPHASDFPHEFIHELKKRWGLHEQYQIYEEAKRLAGLGPRKMFVLS